MSGRQMFEWNLAQSKHSLKLMLTKLRFIVARSWRELTLLLNVGFLIRLDRYRSGKLVSRLRRDKIGLLGFSHGDLISLVPVRLADHGFNP